MVCKTASEDSTASKLTRKIFIPNNGRGKTTIINVDLEAVSTRKPHPFHAKNLLCAHSLRRPHVFSQGLMLCCKFGAYLDLSNFFIPTIIFCDNLGSFDKGAWFKMHKSV